jgi:ATP-dependent Clp protease protease subunit
MSKETGLVYLFGSVTSESIVPLIDQIITANISMSYNLNFITLIINSPGGDLDAAFALIDVMDGSRIPIHTVGLGMVASSALMIFMSGHKGKRVLTPNTTLLSHQWSCGVYGKQHELVQSQNLFEILDNKVYNLYKRKCKLSKKDVVKYLLPPNDVWLTPEDAVKFGICDEIKKLDTKLIS